MLTAIIGIGLPSGGKTALLTQLAVDRNCIYICSSGIRQQVYHELFRNRNVVIDAANTRAQDRQDLAGPCHKYAQKVIG